MTVKYLYKTLEAERAGEDIQVAVLEVPSGFAPPEFIDIPLYPFRLIPERGMKRFQLADDKAKGMYLEPESLMDQYPDGVIPNADKHPKSPPPWTAEARGMIVLPSDPERAVHSTYLVWERSLLEKLLIEASELNSQAISWFPDYMHWVTTAMLEVREKHRGERMAEAFAKRPPSPGEVNLSKRLADVWDEGWRARDPHPRRPRNNPYRDEKSND